MVIGFTQRHQTVPENGDSNDDPGLIEIGVSTERASERENIFRLIVQRAVGTAIVEPLIYDSFIQFDALFGGRNQPGGRIEEIVALEPLSDFIPPRRAFVRNDSRLETDESFTIHIVPLDIVGQREYFLCNGDNDEDATNYFCQQTITIVDDDGKCY